VNTEVRPVDITQHAAQYELLRLQVVGAAGGPQLSDLAVRPRGVGLALLLREGMPAWLKAVDQVICVSPANRTGDVAQPSTASIGYPIGPTWLSAVQPQDITTFLASLVLSTRHIECSIQRNGGNHAHEQ
jgi:hypothetical protein